MKEREVGKDEGTRLRWRWKVTVRSRERTESAAFRSRVNCRDIVDRAARLSIKRLGQNVLLFGARPADEREKECPRLKCRSLCQRRENEKKHDIDETTTTKRQGIELNAVMRICSQTFVFSLIVDERAVVSVRI